MKNLRETTENMFNDYSHNYNDPIRAKRIWMEYINELLELGLVNAGVSALSESDNSIHLEILLDRMVSARRVNPIGGNTTPTPWDIDSWGYQTIARKILEELRCSD